MKPSPISIAMLVVSLFLAPALLAQSPGSANQSAASPAPSASAAEVPRLIKFSGTLLDAQDRPMAGPVGVTFSLHAQQTGGAELWIETQNVKPDAQGVYTVLLGANTTNGVPAELFASGEARWLEVQVERQAEQPRVLLVSVPYALKAGDAQTLGGKPASAFVTTEALASAGNFASAAAAAPTTSTALPSSKAQTTPKKAASGPQPLNTGTTPVTTAGGTVGNLAKFDAGADITNSGISENGSFQVGIGGAPVTTAKLFLTDSPTLFNSARWLQQGLFVTNVTANSTNTALTFDMDMTNMLISPGVTDSGSRIAFRSLSYANNPGFKGTLNQQIGILAQAGIRGATSGASVGNAYGGLFTILNQVAGTTITNAYGVWIKNSDTVGTITNRYDLYASSPNANNFFAGNVGIGTATPAAKLDVAGNLNLPATTTGGTMGVISLGGTRFAHNFGPANAGNTFIGVGAGNFSMTGLLNSAFGTNALTVSTSGNQNSAFGVDVLFTNTTGFNNAAFGVNALSSNTTGHDNSAFGTSALDGLTSGHFNIAIGPAAGTNLTASESNNIYIGNAGFGGESNFIRIGDPLTQTATFIAGISGATSASGTAVLVNSSGQLGTILSSGRFKDDIADMAGESDLLMKLRPVSFYYKPELDPTHTRQYGLVAEEVAQVSPELVVFDKDGLPQTVRYHFVNAMLLNEVQKQRQLLEEQQKANEAQQSTISRQQAEIQALAARLAKLEALVSPVK